MTADPAAPLIDQPGTGAPRPVGGRWASALTLANLGVWVGWFGPIQVLLALQAKEFAPGHKAATLAWVTGVGAVVSLVANPVWGALSDRTTSRFGQRIPWTVGGVICGAAGLVVLSVAPNIAVMLAGWIIVQISLNASYAALTAAVPDQVPQERRGVVGGWLGVAQIAGTLLGTALATLAGGITAGYLACAVFTLLSVVPYVLMRRDVLLDAGARPPFRWKEFLAGFWIDPREHPDFGWAWLTRFLINLSNSIVTMYLLYYLTDAVHYDGKAEDGVLILTALDAVTLLGTVVVGGIWSDRIGKRRIFVFWSGIIMSVATLMLSLWQTWPGAIVAALVLGVGFGVFTSVDFALMTDVLPKAADRGKDLGVINVAAALPQVLAPAIAAPIVTLLGGYGTLYAVAAVIGLAGTLLVYRIRSVP
ncbi:MFS transporter [Actinomadura barringtoniae]|uniref:MFS transporter n=1 Tax=Actinomadura barringtoniae TaxID=1427535 RepID=UPI0027DAC528|nr:MFS transporter [Actinomadura barringtoniae]